MEQFKNSNFHIQTDEMRLRRDFYSKHPAPLPPTPEDRGEVSNHFIYTSDETICLSLEYADDLSGRQEDTEDESGSQLNTKRYLRCPAAVTVGLLKRLIRGKYGLDNDHALDILYGDSFLCDEYSLVDLAYIYNWRRKGPMRLKYRIYNRVELTTTLTNGTNGSEELEETEKSKVQMEIGESGAISISNLDTRNGVVEETLQPVSPNEKKEEPSDSPKPEANTEATPAVSEAPANGETPMEVEDPVETKTEIPVSENAKSTAAADSTNDAVGNFTTAPVAPLRNKTKTLKPPPTWNQSVNRVGIKRTSSTVDDKESQEGTFPTSAKRATPSSPSKVPRFFKVRNAPQPTISPADISVVTCQPPGTSVASVTESPVQEVAVNLTKVPSSPKKSAEKERLTSRDGRVPSPRLDSSSSAANCIRPYSAPAPSQSKRQPSPHLAAEDAAARLRHILNPISSSSAAATSSSGDGPLQHFRFPSTTWLNLARGPSRPLPPSLGIGSPFNNRQPPLSPAHFISSLIASHPNYPYLPPMGLLPPAEGKKSLPASTSSSSSSLVSQQSHKPISPRTSSSFPTPTFNLNTLQQCIYRPNLSPLLPNLPSDLVGSFYHASYVPRPFMSGRGVPSSISPKAVPSSSSTVGNSGFHPSLPPTVTSAPSTGKKSSLGLRQLVPRRTVAPPPPLVPIGATSSSSVRTPPTLLPIKDVVDKEPPVAAKANCVTVVESCVVRAAEDSVPEPENDQPNDSKVESKDPPPKENGQEGTGEADSEKSSEASTTPPLECSKSKTEAEDVKTELGKSEVIASVPS